MTVSPARRDAFDILVRVERDGAWASELLNAPRMERLSREDRALCHELVMSTLRWQSTLDTRIAKYSSKKIDRLDVEVRTALRLAACQLFRLDRIPAHSAVHESVELVKSAGKRSAAPFVNAVLRKLALQQPELGVAGDPEGKAQAAAVTKDRAAGAEDARVLGAEFAHPEWMVARWIGRYGSFAARAICAADQKPPATALRLPPQPVQLRACLGLPREAREAGGFAEIEDELKAEGIRLAPGALLAGARRLLSGNLARSAAFHERRLAVQDEASQLVAALVGRGARILDCCAAPGGKTSAIAARNPGAAIVAVELHEHRARALKERLGALPVQVITGDAAAMEWAEKFDCVLADVPCSGTGTLAAHPEIKWRLRPEDLGRLKDLQVSILRAAAGALAPGGRLVYSTCSLEAEEGEEVVDQVLRGQVLHGQILRGFGALHVVDCKSVLQHLHDSGELIWSEPESLLRGPYLRTLPGIHPCDGFFAAVLRRDMED